MILLLLSMLCATKSSDYVKLNAMVATQQEVIDTISVKQDSLGREIGYLKDKISLLEMKDLQLEVQTKQSDRWSWFTEKEKECCAVLLRF